MHPPSESLKRLAVPSLVATVRCLLKFRESAWMPASPCSRQHAEVHRVNDVSLHLDRGNHLPCRLVPDGHVIVMLAERLTLRGSWVHKVLPVATLQKQGADAL